MCVYIYIYIEYPYSQRHIGSLHYITHITIYIYIYISYMNIICINVCICDTFTHVYTCLHLFTHPAVSRLSRSARSAASRSWSWRTAATGDMSHFLVPGPWIDTWHTNIYIYMYINIYIYIYVYRYVHIYIYRYRYVYIYTIDLYIYIYIYTIDR